MIWNSFLLTPLNVIDIHKSFFLHLRVLFSTLTRTSQRPHEHGTLLGSQSDRPSDSSICQSRFFTSAIQVVLDVRLGLQTETHTDCPIQTQRLSEVFP